mmetsp:Transcript_62762/g.183570  ORF Transcript_62762/g.183570 Transcript_62762/m.183570 type:complete len:100 (-) Transcript_62762:165-464(-)
MADQKERQIQEARELQQALLDISARKEAVEHDTRTLQEELARDKARVQELQAQYAQLGPLIADKSTRLNQIRQAMYQKESEYMAFLEAQPALVHVLRCS